MYLGCILVILLTTAFSSAEKFDQLSILHNTTTYHMPHKLCSFQIH